jgi:hypothetical protein
MTPIKADSLHLQLHLCMSGEHSGVSGNVRPWTSLEQLHIDEDSESMFELTRDPHISICLNTHHTPKDICSVKVDKD